MINYRHDRARQALPGTRNSQHICPPFADALPHGTILPGLSAQGLARAIEQLCKATHTSPTRFGRDAMSDPALVMELRRGRQLGGGAMSKVLAHFDALRAGKAVQHG